MLARRIERPVLTGVAGLGSTPPERFGAASTAGAPGASGGGVPRPAAHGRWRTVGRRPTLGPGGEVRWWERPAPGGDEALWAAVCAVQEARLRRGISVTQLADRVAAIHPMRRETLSRVLNGAQATSWQAVEALAIVLDLDLPVPPPDLDGDAG